MANILHWTNKSSKIGRKLQCLTGEELYIKSSDFVTSASPVRVQRKTFLQLAIRAS